MDFSALPTEVQHNAMQRMDIESFHRTALTSRKMLEVATSCHKYWYGEFVKTSKGQTITIYDRIHKKFEWSNNWTAMHKLLFDNATISNLALYAPVPDGIDLRCENLRVNFFPGDLLPILKRHKPIGKYWIKAEFEPEPEMIEWMNRSIDSVTFLSLLYDPRQIQLRFPLFAYVDLRVPSMSVEPDGSTLTQVIEYIKRLIKEWLQEKREIKEITIDLFSQLRGESPAPLTPFLKTYERIDVKGHRQPFYRIQRRNGDVMALQISEYRLLMRTNSYYLPYRFYQKLRKALRMSHKRT